MCLIQQLRQKLMQTSTEHVKNLHGLKKDKFTEEKKSVKDYLKKNKNKSHFWLWKN